MTFKFDLGDSQHMQKLDSLFVDDVVKLRFYKDAKRGKVVDNDNDEQICHQEYYSRCQKKLEVPLPTFAKIYRNCLLLSQYSMP